MGGICLSCEAQVSPCLVKIQSIGGEIGLTSPGRRPERLYMEAVRSPGYMALPSDVPTRSEGLQGIIFGDGIATGVAGKLSVFLIELLP